MSNKLLQTFKNQKILITGGTGSIGSVMVRKLLEFEPAQIRIFSRDESKHFFLQQELEKEFAIQFSVPKECKQEIHKGFYKQNYCGCCYSLVERMNEKHMN